MAVAVHSEQQQALLPEFLYTSRSAIFAADTRLTNGNSAGTDATAAFSGQTAYTRDGFQMENRHHNGQHRRHFSASENNVSPATMIFSPKELVATGIARAPIEMYSGKFYAASAFGGVLACGLTHAAMTPADVVKCNMQIDPTKYGSTTGAFRTVLREQGARGLLRGWAPTLVGYSAQGACKYGFYEYFKKYYAGNSHSLSLNFLPISPFIDI